MEATTGEWELLDQLRDGVVIADEDMTILYANPTLHRMAACAPGTLAGRPVDILVPADQLRAHRAGVQRVRAGGDGPRLRGPALRT
ncbi:MAG TPA: PAS domain-containing protein, partial [Acidimicrobiales bacterium]|nr:PAS domain-containing protein [Acidimicrobiales bacterium]